VNRHDDVERAVENGILEDRVDERGVDVRQLAEALEEGFASRCAGLDADVVEPPATFGEGGSQGHVQRAVAATDAEHPQRRAGREGR
jgi:hypothetical protein